MPEGTRGGRRDGHDSSRCRFSSPPPGVLSCELAHLAGTDSLMRHKVLGERAGKPANPPVHSCGCRVWLMTQHSALTGA